MAEEEIGTGLKLEEIRTNLHNLFGFSMEHDKKFAEQDEKIKSLEEKINKGPEMGVASLRRRKRRKSKRKKTKRRKPKRR